MNILNFQDFKVESLQEIVSRQKEIMVAFEPNLAKRIEDFDIDIYEDQMLLKDFLLTRTVEEITEAYTAIKANHEEHYLEEIIDVFNFLVEAYILAGFKIDANALCISVYREIKANSETPTLYNTENDDTRLEYIRRDLFSLIQAIGELTNLLKLRPWRSSQYPVDLITFKERWNHLYYTLFDMLASQGITFDILSSIWSKKYQVNKFRIETNY